MMKKVGKKRSKTAASLGMNPFHKSPKAEVDAFAEALESMRPKLHGFVRVLGVADRDAEDTVSQSLLKVLASFGRYNPERGQVTAWVYTITRRVVVDNWRRRRPETIEADLIHDDSGDKSPLDHAAAGKDPLETLIARETSDQFWTLFNTRLTRGQRAALWLSVVEEMTLEEIGCILGVSITTVWRLKQTAIAKLRDDLSPPARQSIRPRPYFPSGPIALALLRRAAVQIVCRTRETGESRQSQA